MIKNIKVKPDMHISNITLGMWGFSGGSWFTSYNEKNISEIIGRAISCGVNLIDTAPIYGFGKCEKILGNILKSYSMKVRVSTKCGILFDKKCGTYFFSRDDYDVYKSLSKESIIHNVDNSLRNLRMDSIDILYTHFQPAPDSGDAIEEVMGTLLDLKDKGKIKAIGASNLSRDQLNKYMTYGGIDIVQEKYNLLDRKLENNLLPYIKKLGLPLHIYSPLEMGILSGRIKPDFTAEKDSARENEYSFQKKNIIRINKLIKQCNFLCERYGCSMSNLALAWLLKGYDKTIILCGSSSGSQIEENVNVCNIDLSEEDYLFMDKLFKQGG